MNAVGKFLGDGFRWRIEELVGGTQDFELGSAVQGMADFLLLLVLESRDVCFRQSVTLVEEVVGGGNSLCHNLRTLLAITLRRKTERINSVLDKVVHHTFCTPLRELLVVLVLASEITMGGQFDGDVGVLVQEDYKAVERDFGTVQEDCRVELVEDVSDEHRILYACQGELEREFLAHATCVDAKFLFMIEIAFASSQEDIVDFRLHFLLETAVTSNAKLQVGSIVANHIDKSFGQLVAVLLVNPTLDGLDDLGMLETHDVVPTPCITSVCAEVPAIVQAFEGHSEVVSAGVHGVLQVLKRPIAKAVLYGFDDVQTAHAHMSVTREIEVSIGTERWEHLVARRVDRPSCILHTTKPVVGQGNLPDVETSLTSWHVACEVEPITIRTDGRMSITGERVFRDLQQLWLAPSGITTGTGVDLGKTGIICVISADCQVHRLAIRREATSTFLVFAIQVALYSFNRFPLAFIVLLREEDVGTLGARNATNLVTFSIIPGAGKVEHVAVVTQKSRTEIASSAGQYRFLLDVVKREGILPLWRKFTSL